MLNKEQIKIKEFLELRNIKKLYHFTKTKNLASILEYGLLSIETLDLLGIDYKHNDEYRFDSKENANCVSISFPNYKMFFNYRRKGSDEWCVIELDPSVLYEKDCLFCIENAATNNETSRSDEDKEGVEGLKQLFGDEEYRRRNKLPIYYTTNPQAEVLVMEDIEVDYIKKIYFDNKNPEFPYRQYPKFKFAKNKDLFYGRYDYENWR